MLDLVAETRTETDVVTAAPSATMRAAVSASPSDTQSPLVSWTEDVRAARGGDRDAFGRLYSGFARMVHAILLSRLRASDAEDAVQDVFVIAMERLPVLRDDSSFGPWLATIARNRATDLSRRAQHRRPTHNIDSEWPDARRAPASSLEQRAEIERALQAIRDLPETYRETMIMRLVEGMTGPEIATRVGLAPGSVRVHLHRGMTLLRERLQTEEGE